MARYATTEERFHCQLCDKWITARELFGVKIKLGETEEYVGYTCPGCRETFWHRDTLPAFVMQQQFHDTVYINDVTC